MPEEQLHTEAWSRTLDRTDDGLLLGVVCGTVGLYERSLMVARTVPVVSWSPDDGSARSGLHISVDDDHGHNWMLPVSRSEAATMVAEPRRRCPRATSEPE